MENVRRIYVEKKNGFDVEAKGVLADLKENLSLKGLKDVRIINRYDVSGWRHYVDSLCIRYW